MNITLSADEVTIERARRVAQAMGKSLNQVVREHLELLAGRELLEMELAEFERSARSTPGRLSGWRFDREEANRRERTP